MSTIPLNLHQITRLVDRSCGVRARLRSIVLRSRRQGSEQRAQTSHEKIVRFYALLCLYRHLHEVRLFR